jgi:hypothetical protein
MQHHLLSPLEVLQLEDLAVAVVTPFIKAKVYLPTVLNPYNFTAILFLEHALKYCTETSRVRELLLKLYAKLGLHPQTKKVCAECKVKSAELVAAELHSLTFNWGSNEELKLFVRKWHDYCTQQSFGTRNQI